MAIILTLSLLIINADFPICTAVATQFYPCAICANGQYYVFWTDYRFEEIDTTYAIFGARVALDGTVIDPDGKQLFKRQSHYESGVAYDGTNFLVVFQDSC